MTFREAIEKSSSLMDQYHIAIMMGDMDLVDTIYPELQYSLDHILDYENTIKTFRDNLEFAVLFSELLKKYEKVNKTIKNIIEQQ